MRLPTVAATLAIALAATAVGLTPPPAQAVGPGGWDHLGSQVLFGSTAAALNGDVVAMSTELPGQLLAAGTFTHAGGVTGADHLASWNGTSWSAVGPPASFGGAVRALAVAGGKIYAGGVFTNAGGNGDADFLAVYDGVSWQPFCTSTNASPSFNGNITALQVIGGDLYVGGAFQDGAGIAAADYLIRCNLASGVASSTNTDAVHNFSGAVYALTSDSSGHLFAGGQFINLESTPASDHIAMFDGTWHSLGTGPAPCDCAVDDYVRSLADDGTNLYIGADSVDVGGIARADHVVRWNGTSWSAVGANAAGTDGYLPAVTSIDALFTSGSHVYASGNWLDVGGDPTADYLADFDGTAWHPVSSNGAGDGALAGKGESFAMFGGVLHVGGIFTKAGGDPLAEYIARFTGVPAPPSNVVKLGKATANKSKGTATLSVTVPGPGVLVLSGKGVKGVTQSAAGAGTQKLKIRTTGRTARKLKQHGKAKVTVTVTYTPTGGVARSETKKVKLVRKS
jgi:hypothetical protein